MRIQEIDRSKPASQVTAVWYKPLTPHVADELKHYAIGDHVIVRLRADAIVKITTALDTTGTPALATPRVAAPKASPTTKKAGRHPSKPTTAERAEIKRQDAALAANPPTHSGYLSEDDEPEEITPAKPARRKLQQPNRASTHESENARARLTDTARDNTFDTPDMKPAKIKCPFCSGPVHPTQDAELLCMNATRFGRKRRHARGERVTSDDE